MNIDNTQLFIGFDLDGVIIDHTQNKLRFAKERGFLLRPEETPSDVMKEKLPVDVYKDIQHHLYGDVPLIVEPSLMKGAIDSLIMFREENIPFVLISRRKNPDVALQYLKERDLVPSVFLPENIFFVERPEDKNKKARELGITHYIDDEIRVLRVLPDVSSKFLFDPFDILPDSIIYQRVVSWDDLRGRFFTSSL